MSHQAALTHFGANCFSQERSRFEPTNRTTQRGERRNDEAIRGARSTKMTSAFYGSKVKGREGKGQMKDHKEKLEILEFP